MPADPASVCDCPCHSTDRADQLRALLNEEYADAHTAAQRAKRHQPVSTTDGIAAVFACAACRQRHCPALAGPPLPLYVWHGTPLAARSRAVPTIPPAAPEPPYGTDGGATDGSESD